MPGFAQLGDAAVNAIVRFITTGEDLPVSGAEHASAPKLSPLKYGIDGYNKFLDPDGYPAITPPWGTLNAINLHTGEYAWKIPFGEIPDLAAKGLTEYRIRELWRLRSDCREICFSSAPRISIVSSARTTSATASFYGRRRFPQEGTRPLPFTPSMAGST